jgi:hypothetical protein
MQTLKIGEADLGPGEHLPQNLRVHGQNDGLLLSSQRSGALRCRQRLLGDGKLRRCALESFRLGRGPVGDELYSGRVRCRGGSLLRVPVSCGAIDGGLR